jgi:hypothetical protein
MILATQNADGSFAVTNGYRRLCATIEIHGQAEVTVAGKPVIVCLVDGKLVARPAPH